MTLVGVRARVTIEAVQADPSDRFYTLTASSTGASSLVAYPDLGLADASGLEAFETQETLQDSGASLTFAWGPMAVALRDLVQPNDLVTVEVADASGAWRLAHLGLVSSIQEVEQGSPTSFRASLRIQSEGLQKLFRQSIYNWQGVMSLGDSVFLGKETFDAYRALVGNDGMTLAPSKIIQALVKIGVSNSIQALVHRRRIAPGDLFDWGPGWGSLYPDAMFPFTAAKLWQEWGGSLWDLLMSLSEPDLHELFWSIRSVGGVDKPVLMHRPRPFPDGKGGQGSKDWLALSGDLQVFGKPGTPGVLGHMARRSDAGRVNAFHWGQEGFQNLDGASQAAKLTLGWWCNKRGIAKYGFAPRQVSIGLLPMNQSYMDLVSSLLKRVAYQEAPLYLMRSMSMGFGAFLPGVHPGQPFEDYTGGTVSTGYITSISQNYRSTPQGVQVSSTVGGARVIRGTTFQGYPDAAAALIDLVKVDYQTQGHPALTARNGAKGVAPAMLPAHAVAAATGIRYADAIRAASVRQSVPAWFLAKLFQVETSMGTDPRMNLENSATALGPMQITRTAFADAVQLGYTTPSGRSPSLEDRRDVATSLDMAAFLVSKRYMAGVLDGGCPDGSPNFWRYVADAYNRGTSAAVASGQVASWSASGLVGYGKDLDPSQAQAVFGGIA